MKYIVVTGGVLSGLGKGITASSIGVLMQTTGYTVTAIKIDPYLNRDAGKMSPYEHGEVYVLNDGSEADLDLGNYERFLNISLNGDHNITTGKVYSHVIEKEAAGEYLGKTVQIIPHITDEIQRRIEAAAADKSATGGKRPDICIIELGGTVGDMESAPFVEALRQFQGRVGRANMCFVHVSLVPVVGVVGEQKTKPTQQSVRTLMGLGITPDIIVCRSTEPLTDGVKAKLSSACGISADNIWSAHDVSDIYAVPELLNKQCASNILCEILQAYEPNPARFAGAAAALKRWTPTPPAPDARRVRVAIVGKYVGLLDSYLSIARAIGHAGRRLGIHTDIEWVDAETLDASNSLTLTPLLQSQCLIVPGGFGDRGVEGKILACQVAREQEIPVLGICLGMQTMLCEHWRNVLKQEGAVIGEAGEGQGPMILTDMGKLRLGSQSVAIVASDSRYSRLHGGARGIDERHRHRFALPAGALNQGSVKGATGFVVVGIGSNGLIDQCAAAERTDHPFYIGVQYHPEFQSRPQHPAPLFLGLLRAALGETI
jgi:CTP synthase